MVLLDRLIESDNVTETDMDGVDESETVKLTLSDSVVDPDGVTVAETDVDNDAVSVFESDVESDCDAVSDAVLV